MSFLLSVRLASASMVFGSLSLLTAMLLATPAIAHTPRHGYTAVDEVAADMMVDHLNSWTAVTKVYRQYGQCDDGGIAEGNSEAIGQLLAKQWTTLPQLSALVAKTPGLQAWVLEHIDTTLDADVLSTIYDNALASCPAGATRLCRSIAAASGRALRAQ